MNIHKHMELIFVVALAVVGLGSYLIDFLPAANASPVTPVARSTATPTPIAVIVIKGQRQPKGV